MVRENMQFLAEQDPELGAAVLGEFHRQERNIELIASENFVSPAVLAAMGTVLTNKYAEGYPGHRYYGGCEEVDKVEELARQRACALFGAEHANVQPHCGASANLAAFLAFLNPGDKVLSMDLANGGHLSHGSPVNISGKHFEIVSYGVDPKTHRIDYDKLCDQAMQEKPKMIIAGASAYPRQIDFARFGEIARACGAYLMVDMAHIAGLVAVGLHPDPVPYADVVTTTTHKTLRGPRGGLILCPERHAKAIDKAIFPGSQGGPLEHIIAGKAVCFAEALRPEFKTYQQKVLDNCRVLAEAMKDEGFDLVSGGTDNHLCLVDLRSYGVSGKEMQERLDAVRITANKNSIPNDPASPNVTSGLRLGSAAATTRGLNEEDMRHVANLIRRTAEDFEGQRDKIAAEVAEICAKYPMYQE